jgi:hypothetical protein
MESQFFGSLKAEHLEGKWWRLSEPLAFYSKRYDMTICAPARFVTDFASVPRLPLAYLFAGGTGHWEAVIHDVLYRFGMPPRSTADQIFFECGRVRAGMRKNQNALHRAGRLIRTSLMTGAVILLGWVNYKPLPGCLDYREKDLCGRHCIRSVEEYCNNFYPAWPKCSMPGYVPDILSIHGGAA